MLKLLDVGNAKRRQANLLITILLMLLGGCSQESAPVVDISTPGVYVLGAGDDVQMIVVDREGRKSEYRAKVGSAGTDAAPGGHLMAKYVQGEIYTVEVTGCPSLQLVGVRDENRCLNCSQFRQDPDCPMDLVELDNLSWQFQF